MMKISVYKSYEQIDEELRLKLENKFLRTSEYSKEWFLFLENNLLGYEPLYFIGGEEDDVDFFSTGFIARKLNVANYLSNKPKAMFDWLDKYLINPLKFNVVFIKNPLSNFEGIHSSKQDKLSEFIRECKNYIYHVLKFDSIFIGNVGDAQLNAGITEAEFIKIPYYPNTLLSTDFTTFDEYLLSVKKKKRWDIKNKIKTMHQYGASIEVVNSINHQESERIYELYNNTAERGDASPYPIIYSKSSFGQWDGMGESYKWILVKFQSKIIAFAMVVKEGNSLLFKHVGMDYEHSTQCFAYFNLYYEAIRLAIEENFQSMYCGPTTYETKKSLGCQLVELNAYLSVKNFFLEKAMGKVLTKAFK
ncbi:peptidogalycan biosysnthesis protein [Halalkalibacter alkalisediminis]|uniref:Peptidogalycan biosysnthesis protein n=1 Tax=Halalkalibacter alkalisediminis TaxID=935616 RepID=A0ABV6NMD7_9BACI|nr:peptidogalycan biosysnthesis protein [Halalkalibacter alkalisediminis]